MKIQYCSDLHLEFEDNLNFLSNCPIKRVGDILIIAGDLVPFVNLSKALYKSEIADLCKGFEKVFGCLATTSITSIHTTTPAVAVSSL